LKTFIVRNSQSQYKNKYISGTVFMQSFVDVKAFSRICIIVVLLVLVMAVPVSAVSEPTIDSVTPSTTSVVNGGKVIFTVSGTCSAPVSQGWITYHTPQTGWTSGFNVVTNGNQWTGQYSIDIPSNSQSGQYSITEIQVQDSAGNHVSKNFNVIVISVNSDKATPTWTPNQIAAPTISPIPPFTPQTLNTPYPLVTPTWTSNQIAAPTVSPIPPFTPQIVNTQTPPQTQQQTKTTPLLYAPIGAIVLMVGISIWSRRRSLPTK
jgi:hypothetical protein